MATQLEKIEKLEAKVKLMKETLEKYRNMFNSDKSDHKEELKQLDETEAVIQKVEAKLEKMIQRTAEKTKKEEAQSFDFSEEDIMGDADKDEPQSFDFSEEDIMNETDEDEPQSFDFSEEDIMNETDEDEPQSFDFSEEDIMNETDEDEPQSFDFSEEDIMNETDEDEPQSFDFSEEDIMNETDEDEPQSFDFTEDDIIPEDLRKALDLVYSKLDKIEASIEKSAKKQKINPKLDKAFSNVEKKDLKRINKLAETYEGDIKDWANGELETIKARYEELLQKLEDLKLVINDEKALDAEMDKILKEHGGGSSKKLKKYLENRMDSFELEFNAFQEHSNVY